MQSMLSAKTAILIHFKSVRVILLVFLSIVVSLLAFAADKCDLYSQFRHLLKNLKLCLYTPQCLPPSDKKGHTTFCRVLLGTRTKPSLQR